MDVMQNRKGPKPSRTREEAALDRIEAIQARWGNIPPSWVTLDDMNALRAFVLAGDVAGMNGFADACEAMRTGGAVNDA